MIIIAQVAGSGTAEESSSDEELRDAGLEPHRRRREGVAA